MLVLSRKQGQRIQLGNDTTITITRIQGNTVRIGIEAPDHVTVMRAELLGNEQEDLAANFQAERVGPPRGAAARPLLRQVSVAK